MERFGQEENNRSKGRLVMKKLLVTIGVLIFAFAAESNDGLSSFEDECCRALANQSILTSAEFTNRLVGIVGTMTNHEIRIDAMLVLALSEYQRFDDTAESQHLVAWHEWVTNAVAQTTSPSGGWRYGCSRFLDVAYHVMEENYAVAYEKSTNTLVSLEQCQSSNSSNGLEYAVSGFYKMPGLSATMALKALCGASAARLSYVGVATNYAFQVGEPHRTIILSLLGEGWAGK